MARRKRRGKFGGRWLVVCAFVVLVATFALWGMGLLPTASQLRAALPFARDAQGEMPLGLAQGEGVAVYYLPVGKADAMLVVVDGHSMLIDAGTRDMGDFVARTIAQLGVRQLDVAVATHPHEDHIGGFPKVLKKQKPKMLYMSAREHTTRAYEELLLGADEYAQGIVLPQVGEQFMLGGATCTFIAPLETYDTINDASLVLRMEYGERVWLFTGDAETPSEREMVRVYGDGLRCDVLKVAHHGSNTSSRDYFLEAAAPAYAVITCGAGEGGPNDKVLGRLRQHGATLYDTAQGALLCRSDGVSIEFSRIEGIVQPQVP